MYSTCSDSGNSGQHNCSLIIESHVAECIRVVVATAAVIYNSAQHRVAKIISRDIGVCIGIRSAGLITAVTVIICAVCELHQQKIDRSA